ncbi:MAG: DUF1398 domain-containing protein [Minisyncoccota bacterium]
MDSLIEKLQNAQKKAMENRPKVGGFPYLAETLRQVGVKRNTWTLPVCQSVYFLEEGAVIQLGNPVAEGVAIAPAFDEEALIVAIRTDQAGESTFPEFLRSAWNAGVLWYDVDFEKRTVIYGGVQGEIYTESYPEVTV